MDLKFLQQLKVTLKEVITKNDIARSEKIRKIVQIPNEKDQYYYRDLAGISSVYEPWMKKYQDYTREIVLNKKEKWFF